MTQIPRYFLDETLKIQEKYCEIVRILDGKTQKHGADVSTS